MIAVERSFVVHRPLSELVAYLEDFARAEEWDPGTVSCVRLDDGPVRPGARWRNTSRFRGRTTELDYRLVVREPARLVFVGENGTVTAVDDLRFVGVGVGEGGDAGGGGGGAGPRTRLTYRASLTFKGLARLAAPFLRPEFERLADGVTARLPAAAEKRPS
ncbi:SRPBCC family protein [Streptomyces sp. NRRL S-87]|uniref:SRPBCC family protein n=1 Tax=Streptomyces sp. NRRL S-87 TaxID=1463920 RepID=UPI0004BEF6AF|nr:SRPBCC family protein [Streptomyces sp. NRRL S-87]